MGQVQKLLDDIESHVCCCTVLVLYLEAEESQEELWIVYVDI